MNSSVHCLSFKSFAEFRLPNVMNPIYLSRRVLLISYAFVMSDLKTIVFPVLAYALMTVPPSMINPATIPRLAFWIIVHLLQFCASNQLHSIEEDSLNKPYRPLPAGLMDVHSCQLLRWILLPFCLCLCYAYNVTLPGLSLALAFIAYNELGLDSVWHTKSLLNAIGIVSWNVGAAAIAQGGGDFEDEFEGSWIAPYLSVALIWSTIHIQDFRDEAGDRLQGRVTLPILMPEWSRRLTVVLLGAWSAGLALYWNMTLISTLVFTALGGGLGLHIYWQRTEEDDKASLRLYMIWLTIAQAAPFWTQRLRF